MTRPDRTRPILIAAVSFALAVAGVGVAGTGSHIRAADATVKITDSAYDPKTVTVTAGSVVTWTNTGSKVHTVTADGGSFDSGDVAPGEAFGNLFDTAGTFAYHDTHDAAIKGSVIVKAAAPTPTPNGTPKPTPPPGTLPPDFKTPEPVVTAEPSASPTPVASATGAGAAAGDSAPLIIGILVVAVIAAVAIYTYWRRRRE